MSDEYEGYEQPEPPAVEPMDPATSPPSTYIDPDPITRQDVRDLAAATKGLDERIKELVAAKLRPIVAAAVIAALLIASAFGVVWVKGRSDAKVIAAQKAALAAVQASRKDNCEAANTITQAERDFWSKAYFPVIRASATAQGIKDGSPIMVYYDQLEAYRLASLPLRDCETLTLPEVPKDLKPPSYDAAIKQQQEYQREHGF